MKSLCFIFSHLGSYGVFNSWEGISQSIVDSYILRRGCSYASLIFTVRYLEIKINGDLEIHVKFISDTEKKNTLCENGKGLGEVGSHVGFGYSILG